jgi:hypothetical protein
MKLKLDIDDYDRNMPKSVYKQMQRYFRQIAREIEQRYTKEEIDGLFITV